nr:IPT/TIG domain-containing protein [Anaerolineales bacterium]
VGVFVETPKIMLAPGASGTATVTLFNEGQHDDHFILSLSGPPTSWCAVPGPHHLRAGASSVLRLLFHPPSAPTTRAGAYPVTVRVASQLQPEQVVEAQLTLVVTAFADFTSALKPPAIAAGAPAAITLVNAGNTPATFSLRWDSDDDLVFQPPTAEVTLAEAETAAVEFTADLQHARWIGGARRHPYRAHITAASGLAQTHAGVVVTTGLLPLWILGLVILALVIVGALLVNNLGPLTPAAGPGAASLGAVTQAAATLRARAAATGTALWLAGDTDRDGLPNQAELTANTLLDKFDTDEDGLSDGEEIARGTSPLKPDTDGDGLPDGEDLRRGLDPLQADSDGDQTPDAADAVFGPPNTPTVEVTVTPAVIALTALSPNTLAAGGGAFTLTLTGANFTPGLVARWNGADRPTAFVNAGLLTAAIPAEDVLQAGPINVTVYSPTLGSVVAGPLAVSIQNPLPTLNAGGLVPATALAGGQAFTLVVNGANFVAGSVVRWNGADRITAFTNRGQLVAFINAADLAQARTVDVVVFNPGPGGGLSNAQSFVVGNPAPALAALTPSAGLVSGAPFTVTVTGTNFVPGAVARWNGADRPTTLVTPSRLEVMLLAGDLAVAGPANLSVANPAPGGGVSNSLPFPVNYPAPAITASNPLTATAGGPAVTLVITGTGFVTGISTVTWNGALRPTTVISSTQLTAPLTAGDLAAAGLVTIAIFNPTPGGGLSQTLPFTITLAP